MDRIQKTLNNLQKNGFSTKFFKNSNQATNWMVEQLSINSIAAFGGSESVYQTGLADKLIQKKITILDYWQVPLENRREIFLRSLDADAYFCSANAITEDGFYLNVDGAGNRTASTIYGPKKLFIVAGVNKLVKDIDAAYKRVKLAAPKNCKRMNLPTPCVADGVCHDCEDLARACRVYVLTKRPARTMETTIVLIDEELGY